MRDVLQNTEAKEAEAVAVEAGVAVAVAIIPAMPYATV